MTARKQEMRTDLAVQEPRGAVTPMRLLEIATQQGADVDKLGKLMELQMRWEANEARKAFVGALNEFKRDPPKISKNKQVDFQTTKGRTTYKHATLDKVSDTIGAALAQVGISHRWETEQLDGGLIRVTCILTHDDGHSERVALQAGRDDSGNKNNIQAVGSTVTYLQRYTLLAATGMAVQDQDDDGAGGKINAMTENAKADWFAAIEALDTREAAQGLWQKIAAACTQAGDVASYDQLKGVFAKKLKTLPAEGAKA